MACVSGIMSFHKFGQRELTMHDCLYAVFISLMFLTAAMVFERSSTLHRNPESIWAHLIKMENLLIDRFQLRIDFREFNKCFVLKLWLMLFCYSALVTIKIVHRINPENIVRQVGALILQFLALLSNFQILFYVSIFNFFLLKINHHVQRIVDTDFSDECIEDIKIISSLGPKIFSYYQKVKLIHFKLWEIIQLINDDFGAILTILIIMNTNTSIQTFYWIIVELCEDDLTTNKRIISKKLIQLFRIRQTSIIRASI